MKAIAVRLPATLESLVLEEREESKPGHGQVKVQWRALSLNFHDLAITTGMLPTADGRIPISDAAGELIEIGPGVTGWEVGDRVMSTFFPDWLDGEATAANTARLAGDSIDGCALERSVVDPTTLTRIPRGYTFEQAATLPCAALTAWRALVDVAAVQRGHRVLVQGTGGVSVFALQLAKALGAQVFATSSSPEKCERLRGLGADYVIDYRNVPDWAAQVVRQSDGGVDVTIDVGGPATLEQSLAATRTSGHIVCVGLLGGLEARLPIPTLLLKQQHIRPIAVGSHAHQRRMVQLLEFSGIQPVIDRVFPFERFTEALRYQMSAQHFGKIVVQMERS